MAGSVAPTNLEEAITIARSRLDHARRRFLRQDLPPLGHMIVRHQIPVPGGAEALWTMVSSWQHACVIRGRSLNDGVHPSLAYIRMGSPVMVDTKDVIDWAVVGNDGSIEEGGWTRGMDVATAFYAVNPASPVHPAGPVHPVGRADVSMS